jgi:hypothetical protein
MGIRHLYWILTGLSFAVYLLQGSELLLISYTVAAADVLYW